VVAADEWAENVDNNAFTNAAAKANLQLPHGGAALGHSAQCRLDARGENIPVLKMENGVTQEHATYKGEGIKQADVNLLAYPLKEITDPKQIRKTWNITKPGCPTKARRP
jgi:trehalose/maltose hydrolase-like predicted phosphorylase